ncbi:hypothetical protein FOL47_004689, partial [Perkinsus chesapeaki]
GVGFGHATSYEIASSVATLQKDSSLCDRIAILDSRSDNPSGLQGTVIDSIVKSMPTSLKGTDTAVDVASGQRLLLKPNITASRLLWSAAYVTGDLQRDEELSSCCSSSSSSSSSEEESSSDSEGADSPSRTPLRKAAKLSRNSPDTSRRPPARRIRVMDGLPTFALKGYRLKLFHKALPEILDCAALDSSARIYRSPKAYRDFIVLPGFLSAPEIDCVVSVSTSPTVSEIKDRKDNLDYKHRAFRVEAQMRLLEPDLYQKLMTAVKYASDRLWGVLGDYKQSYPEMEYIVYDTSEGEGMIEKHVDNYSLVTFVCLLSTPGVDFTGGVNCFKHIKEQTYERRKTTALDHPSDQRPPLYPPERALPYLVHASFRSECDIMCSTSWTCSPMWRASMSGERRWGGILEALGFSYHPGRARTETARRLVMHMQSNRIRRKFPQLKTSYELFGYDAPATARFKMQDGRDYEFSIEQFTLEEIQAEIHKSQFSSMLAHMKTRSLEKLTEDD